MYCTSNFLRDPIRCTTYLQPLLLLIGIPTLALTPSPCSFEWLIASKSHVALVLILSTAALQCLRYLIEQVEVDKLRPRLPG